MSRRITRKEFLSTSAKAVAGFGALSAPRQSSRARFNILCILTDQERSWETLPAGLDLPRHYDFAASAINFTNHHITTVSCGPSRATIFTGQHVQRTRVTENPSADGFGLWLDPKRTPTIAEMLRREGYRTAYKGKWHLSHEGELDDYTRALDRFGFDEWHPFEDTFGRAHEGFNLDPNIAREASEFLTEPADTPWFLTVSLINPHDTMWFDATGRQAETRVLNPFVSAMNGAPDAPPYNEDLGLPLPRSFADDLTTKPDVQHRFIEQARYFYGEMELDDEAAFARAQNHYFNCLRDVDRHIGTILDALEASGQADKTVVILTADHGEMGAAHKMRNKGPLLYRENVTIPFAVRHPDIVSGGASDEPMSSVDIVPTILGLAGIDRDRYPDLKGHDFTPVLESPSTMRPREAVLFNFSNATQAAPRLLRREMLHYKRLREGEELPPLRFPEDYVQFDVRQFGRALFDGRFKFGRWFSPGDHHRPETWAALLSRNDLELYDTESDPHEMVNLAIDPEGNKPRILELNRRLNRLLDDEVGVDDGSHMPGSRNSWES